ncbi:MAG: hypothetical protein AAF654_12185 [Myxococcota bacterium]
MAPQGLRVRTKLGGFPEDQPRLGDGTAPKRRVEAVMLGQLP